MRLRPGSKRHRGSKAKFVRWIKEGHPCMDCGGLFPPAAIDFDHCRGVKLMELSDGSRHARGYPRLRGATWMQVIAELKKCDVVCKGCHQRRTTARIRFPWRSSAAA
jgi:hypothetical protein